MSMEINQILLNNQLFKLETMKDIRKYFDMNPKNGNIPKVWKVTYVFSIKGSLGYSICSCFVWDTLLHTPPLPLFPITICFKLANQEECVPRPDQWEGDRYITCVSNK